ncbi:hypothetical protein, partial [Rhizobium leguminosarum]|uniref:hypothetical protein n=1 Tax=Rhizobium leguminosarum TaxID=384 RepID=UPI003F9AA1DC
VGVLSAGFIDAQVNGGAGRMLNADGKRNYLAVRQIISGSDRFDAAAGNDEGFAVMEALAVENAGAEEDLSGHKTVSVTLSRFAGLSGSKPL